MSEAGRQNLLKIAQVVKSNGTDGEMLISFFDIDPQDVNLKEPVFVYYDGLPVPFFFDSFEPRNSTRALVRITGITSLTDAEEIVGQGIYAEAPRSGDNVEDSLDDLIGWTVTDRNQKVLGTITDFEDIPGNLCAYIATPAETKMIPFHEDLILSVDKEAQIVVMDIPDGLL